MYAIIRAGGKQAKVREGDVLDVERIKQTESITFTPLLVVTDDGDVISDRDALQGASVVAEVVGQAKGPKVDVFKYKSKSGYRRRQGHRQKYTTIKVTKIETKAPAKKASSKKQKQEAEPVAAEAAAEATPEADASAEEE